MQVVFKDTSSRTTAEKRNYRHKHYDVGGTFPSPDRNLLMNSYNN